MIRLGTVTFTEQERATKVSVYNFAPTKKLTQVNEVAGLPTTNTSYLTNYNYRACRARENNSTLVQ